MWTMLDFAKSPGFVPGDLAVHRFKDLVQSESIFFIDTFRGTNAWWPSRGWVSLQQWRDKTTHPKTLVVDPHDCIHIFYLSAMNAVYYKPKWQSRVIGSKGLTLMNTSLSQTDQFTHQKVLTVWIRVGQEVTAHSSKLQNRSLTTLIIPRTFLGGRSFTPSPRLHREYKYSRNEIFFLI